MKFKTNKNKKNNEWIMRINSSLHTEHELKRNHMQAIHRRCKRKEKILGVGASFP
jgi:hypothetical protein